MKRSKDPVAVFSVVGKILRVWLAGWLTLFVIPSVVGGTGEDGDSAAKAPVSERPDSPQPLSSRSPSLAERWQAESRIADLRAKVRASRAEHDVEEALAAQHELVSVLEEFVGPGHWRTKSSESAVAELNELSKLPAKDRVRYLAAYDKVVEAERQVDLGQYSSAQDLLESAIPTLVTLLGEKHPCLARASEQLGLVFLETNRPTAAKEHFARAAAIAESLLGKDHPHYSGYVTRTAKASFVLGDYDQAEALIRDALSRDRRVFGTESFRYAKGLLHLSGVMRRKKNFVEAEAFAVHSLSIAQSLRGPVALFLSASCLSAVAEVNMAYREYDQAESNLQRSVRIYETRLPPNVHPSFTLGFARVLDTYTSLLRDLGRDGEADALEAKAKEAREQMRGDRREETHQSESSGEDDRTLANGTLD